MPFKSNVVKTILRNNHIFNNIFLASKLQIIKTLSKSDMVIVQLDIQDIQSGSNAKCLINRCFNIESYITTIQDTNMNSGISQYKNCWKWGYMSGIQYKVYIQYQPDVKAKLDIVHFQYNWFSDWFVSNNTLSSLVKLRAQGASSTIVCMKQDIINTLLGAAR